MPAKLFIIPIKAGQKAPHIDWKKYQHKAASYEQIVEWGKQHPNCNWAVVTGKVSNVMVVDCDNDAALQAAEALG
ncbi:MAG: bifunctional DNA primase/polymerase, partial [Colwellia sp.]